MATITTNMLIQAFSDAGITDQATATRFIRLLYRDLIIKRNNELMTKGWSGIPLTQAETGEMASNDAAILNLTQLLG